MRFRTNFLVAAVLVAVILTVFTVHAAMKTASTASRAATGAVKGAVSGQGAVKGAVENMSPRGAAETYTLYYGDGLFPLLVSVTHLDNTPPEDARLDPGEKFTFTARIGDSLIVRADQDAPYYYQQADGRVKTGHNLAPGLEWACQYTVVKGTAQPGEHHQWDTVSRTESKKIYMVGGTEFSRMIGE
ncbi:hypothetical protein G7K71_02835 [Desulfofundulus sp. TPOSR]|uniref:hypothetical protein n=1 Tax=Desulfofundulus sp. TPOSR TaxID=2714340 RepID=UPI00140987A8|nr:hypothetical protein [Desulfofundulus sp. TPOSR]NHM25962.1 hypothetical protein [Desulfofundulus sp. TPOSR]